MTCRLTILTGLDSSPCLVLTDPSGANILVNCGEGCQRSFLECNSVRLSAVKCICLTELNNAGGLPGALLTIADSQPKKASLQVVGPVGTSTLLNSFRHFMRKEALPPLIITEGNVSSVPAIISDEKPPTTSFSITTLSQQSTRKRPRSPLQSPAVFQSYLLTTAPLTGKFSLQKVQALGVPRGPLYGRLQQGHSVTFETSTGQTKTVHSHQVLAPPAPGVAVAVLRYSRYDSIPNAQELQPESCLLQLVVHLTTAAVYAETLDWRRSFPDTTEHVLVHMGDDNNNNNNNNNNKTSPFHAAMHGAHCRSLLCPSIYLRPVVPYGSDTSRVYQLLPRPGDWLASSTTSLLTAPETLLKTTGALEKAREFVSLPTRTSTGTGKLVFTGTGSAIPCKHRNVTGMLLTCDNGKSMLLDAGEGTLGQLQSCQQSVDHIAAIWVSHMHADHHLGLLGLLTQAQNQDEELIIIAPPALFLFLQECREAGALVPCRPYRTIDAGRLMTGNNEECACLREALGISHVQSVSVAHCPHAYAIILQDTCFGKLVYSGDCRPSKQLALTAKGAHLLIHEATFENGMEAQAVLKKHSTIGEALQVGADMQAECVVLTHFSQRYPKVPPMPDETTYRGRIIFAFDFMQVRPDMLEEASKITPAVRLLYPQEASPEDEAPEDEMDKTLLNTPGYFAQQGIL